MIFYETFLLKDWQMDGQDIVYHSALTVVAIEWETENQFSTRAEEGVEVVLLKSWQFSLKR